MIPQKVSPEGVTQKGKTTMPIDMTEFTENIESGVKSNSTSTKFFYRFKIDGITKRGVIDYSDKAWDKRTRISKIKAEIENIKSNVRNPKTELSEKIKLDTFIEMHFDNLPKTTWTETKRRHYTNYIAKELGNKKVIDIKQMHIEQCIKKQAELHLAPRTIKTTLEILNPAFKKAMANRLIDFNPCFGITIQIQKTKKTVLYASEQLSDIYQAILKIFSNNPYYLSFYLFALQGRRKSEILNLKWELIDFKNNRYLLEDTKNGDHQMYFLPPNIKTELLKFRNSKGWIYESPVFAGKRLEGIEKQTKKIKALIPNFTLHYMRNVIVSAMAEQGVSATLMSGALGHNNTSTLSKYLSLNHVQGSEVANQTIENITNNIR